LVRKALQELVDVALAGQPVGAGRRLDPAEREVHLEHGLEGLPVGIALDERRRQRVLERLTILEWDVAHGLHGVKVLGQRHRQPRGSKLLDEARHQVDHWWRMALEVPTCGSLTQARPQSAPWWPWRCRFGT